MGPYAAGDFGGSPLPPRSLKLQTLSCFTNKPNKTLHERKSWMPEMAGVLPIGPCHKGKLELDALKTLDLPQLKHDYNSDPNIDGS